MHGKGEKHMQREQVLVIASFGHCKFRSLQVSVIAARCVACHTKTMQGGRQEGSQQIIIQRRDVLPVAKFVQQLQSLMDTLLMAPTDDSTI
jgi:hypothetical protein